MISIFAFFSCELFCLVGIAKLRFMRSCGPRVRPVLCRFPSLIQLVDFLDGLVVTF